MPLPHHGIAERGADRSSGYRRGQMPMHPLGCNVMRVVDGTGALSQVRLHRTSTCLMIRITTAAATTASKKDQGGVTYRTWSSLWEGRSRPPGSHSHERRSIYTRRQQHHHHHQRQRTRRNFSHTSTFEMQDNVAKLYPNPDTSAKVMEYSIAKSTPLPDWLLKYHKWGCENTAVPSFLTSTYQAQMLIFLAKMVNAKKGAFCLILPLI